MEINNEEEKEDYSLLNEKRKEQIILELQEEIEKQKLLYLNRDFINNNPDENILIKSDNIIKNNENKINQNQSQIRNEDKFDTSNNLTNNKFFQLFTIKKKILIILLFWRFSNEKKKFN